MITREGQASIPVVTTFKILDQLPKARLLAGHGFDDASENRSKSNAKGHAPYDGGRNAVSDIGK
jgi:hypothetical protein